MIFQSTFQVTSEHKKQSFIIKKKHEPGHEKTCLMSYANNKGADQPAHQCSLISTFIVRCLDSVMSLVSVTKISSLMLASVAEQASLSLTWLETPEDTFSHDDVHIHVCQWPHNKRMLNQRNCNNMAIFIMKSQGNSPKLVHQLTDVMMYFELIHVDSQLLFNLQNRQVCELP